MKQERRLKGIDDEAAVASVDEEGRPVIPEDFPLFERVGYEFYGADFDPYAPDCGYRYERINSRCSGDCSARSKKRCAHSKVRTVTTVPSEIRDLRINRVSLLLGGGKPANRRRPLLLKSAGIADKEPSTALEQLLASADPDAAVVDVLAHRLQLYPPGAERVLPEFTELYEHYRRMKANGSIQSVKGYLRERAI